MGTPLVDCGRRLRNSVRLARGADAVIERQLDDLGDQGLIDQDQDTWKANDGRSLHALISRREVRSGASLPVVYTDRTCSLYLG